jgi:hypothetical protein
MLATAHTPCRQSSARPCKLMGVIGGRCSRRQRDSERHHRECRLPHSHDLLEHLERVMALPERRMNDGRRQLDRHHRLLGLRLLDYGDPWTFHTPPLAQEVRHTEAARSRGQHPPRAVSAIVTLVLKVGARKNALELGRAGKGQLRSPQSQSHSRQLARCRGGTELGDGR